MNWKKAALIKAYKQAHGLKDHVYVEDNDLIEWLYDELFEFYLKK